MQKMASNTLDNLSSSEHLIERFPILILNYLKYLNRFVTVTALRLPKVFSALVVLELVYI
ncbi:hypothetical protein J605_3553 [Acinetobacter baumannii 1412924]|nr:hypothetical protein J605_3553 [Acinetobacter baumannii 1412924]